MATDCLQATSLDQAAGWGMVGLAFSIFLYYTAWVIILPFVEADQSIHQFFLPRIYAIAVPLIAGVIALVLIGSFVGYVTFKSKLKKLKTS